MANQITRDIYVLRKSIIEPIHYVRLTNAVDIVFNMRDYDIPSGAVAAVYAQKPDGTAVYSNATISENTVTVEMTTQMVAVLGVGHLQVRIQSGSNSADVLCSFVVPLIVEPNFTEGDFPPSQNENGFFGDVEEHLQQVESDMATMKEEWTEFQSDITQQVQEIQEEQTTQGNEITDLQKKVAKLDEEKSPALVLDASGSWVTVEDSGNSAANGLTIHGKSTQVVTTGAQLFDKDAEIYSQFQGNSATPTDTGITVTGPWYVAYELSLPQNANVYVSFQASGNTRSISFYKNKSFLETDRIVTIGSSGQGVFNTEDFEGIIAAFYSGNGKSGTTTYTNVMFNLGTAALPWEPYTGGAPSPSPDYPQEITSVGDSGSVEVVSTGENLFNINGDISSIRKNEHSAVKNYSKDNIIYVINPTSFYLSQGYVFKCYPGKKYFFKAKCLSIGSGGGLLMEFNTNERYGVSRRVIHENEEAIISFIPNQNENYAVAGFAVSSTDKNIEIPAQATDIVVTEEIRPPEEFIPYRSSTATFSTPNGLPGIPVDSGGNYTDADGQQWICDEIDTKAGVYRQRVIKKIFTGEKSEFWLSNKGEYQAFGTSILSLSQKNCGLCNRLKKGTTIASLGNAIGFVTSKDRLYIANGISETTAELNDWLKSNPLEFFGALATPVETPLSDAELIEAGNLRTFATTTNVTTGDPLDPEITLEYAADLKTYIDKKLAEISAATLENATNASQ